jgi:hypothetical protein
MEPVPWMVAYGATVFRAGALGAALLGLAASAAVSHGLLRREARRVRERLGESAGAGGLRDGASVTLGGTITVSDERGPALLCEGVVIGLQGTIELLVGTQRCAAGKGLPPSVLREGDRVRVRGRLQQEPVTDQRLEYRAMERRWQLVPEGWGDLLLVFEAGPRAEAPSWRALCRSAGAWVMAFTAAVTLAGEAAARITEEAGSLEQATSAAALTLASPLHRDRALAQLSEALAQRCAHEYDEEHVEAQLRVAELRADCEGSIALMLEHGLYARAAQRARVCGDASDEARAHYLSGHFAEANVALAHGSAEESAPARPSHDAVFALRAHVLARRFTPAAEVARKVARGGKERDPSSELAPDDLRCLAEVLERRAHAEAALPEASALEQATLGCRILYADAAPALRTAAVLHTGPTDGPPALRLYAETLALEARLEHADAQEIARLCATASLPDPPLLARPLGLFGHAPQTPALGPPALARSVLERLREHAGRCPLRAHLGATMASFEAVHGDAREARRWAEQMEADLAPESDQGQRATLLRAAIAVYTGEVSLALGLIEALPEGTRDRRELTWLAELRAQGRQAMLSAPQEALGVILVDASAHEPWSITAQGDGARLAHFLQRNHAQARRDGGYWLIAPPRLERGREDLLRWFRWGERSASAGLPPSLLLAHARSREAAVEALGDRILAAEEREVAEAFYRAFSARDLALPLALIDLL